MEIFLDCLPCVLRQVLEASRMATDKTQLQIKIMEESIRILADYKNYKCSPDIVRDMHQIVKRLTGINDPYKTIKEHDMNGAKKMYPQLKQFIEQKQNGLYWALKIAATGNIIDSAIYNNVNLQNCIKKELAKDFSICDIDIFQEKLKTANSILVIGDNAGETVFDRVLIENLIHYDITYAVRSEPIINDATIQDAYDSGLYDIAKIISTGCGAPGAIPDQCSTEFLNLFHSADIVISKGQGNFEALSDCDRSIFFLLKAKCSMIAGRLSVDLNDYVLKYHKTELI